MNGISKITDKIISEAKCDADEILRAADAEAEQIMESYRLRAKELRKKADADAEHAAAAIVTRAKSSASMEQRNILLSARVAMVDRAFDKAREELRSLPEEKYLNFLSSLLLSLLRSLRETEQKKIEEYGEDEDLTPAIYEIALSEQDLSLYGKRFMDYVRHRVIGSSYAELFDRVRLSATPAPIDGGLVLLCGDVSVNASLSTLIDQARARLESRVDQTLFRK